MKFYDPSFVYKGKQDNVLDVEPSNQDLTDSEYQYYGFVSPRTGAWIIQRFHVIASAIIYEYASGRSVSDYAGCWDTSGVYVGELEFKRIDLVVPL